MRRLFGMIVIVAAMTPIARAAPAARPAPAKRAPPPAKRKDPAVAVVLSLGGWFVGYVGAASGNAGLAMIGGMVGPSLGEWYAGQSGLFGIGARIGGLVLLFHGFEKEDRAAGTDCFVSSTEAACKAVTDERDREFRSAKIYERVGLGVWAVASLYDVIQAGRAASRWNREHATVVMPTLVGRSPGLAIGLRF